MEKLNISAFEAELKSAGMDEAKISADIQANYLPESGTFESYEIVNANQPTVHVRMLTTNGGSISLNGLRGVAHFGDKESITLGKIEKAGSTLNGKFAMKSVTNINPQLGGKIAKVVSNLLGRDFKAVATPGYVLRTKLGADLKPVGYDTEAKAKEAIVSKNFYKVEIIY